MTVRSKHHLVVPALAGLVLSGLTACYSAEFDPNADEVFVCSLDEECNAGSTCEAGLCVVNEGPELEITGPEPLVALAEGASTFDLTIRGSSLTLVEPGGEPVEGEGYIEVNIDGLNVLDAVEQTQISDGNLATGIVVTGIELPDLTTTIHRVSAQAFRADGTPYLNQNATARQVFFRNKPDPLFTDEGGLLPQIAVLEPWPGEEIPATEEVTVSVGAINWTWDTPAAGGVVKDPADPDTVKEGHTHIYFNLDEASVAQDELPYPECLPTCNLNYATTFNPDSAGTDNSKILSGPVPLAEEFATKPSLNIRVGLQWNDHVPWPAPSNNEDEWDITDGTTTRNARELLVNDEIDADLIRP